MRFYRKTPLELSGTTVRKSIPLDVSKGEDGGIAYSMDSSGGKLRSGIGANALELSALPEGETLRAVFEADGAYALYCESGKMYSQTASGLQESGIGFSKMPVSVRFYDGGEKVLLSDGAVSAVLDKNGTAQKEIVFSAAVFAYGRLWYCNDGLTLYFSEAGNVFNFEPGIGLGGTIELSDRKGKIEKLVFFQNDIYIVREYGVQKLEAYGDEKEFRVEDVFSCAKIYGQSAAATERTLFFLAEDGLHSYGDGKIADFAEHFLSEQTEVRGAASDGKYFLTAETSGNMRALGVFDENTGGGYLVAENCTGLSDCSGKILFVLDGKGYEITRGGAFAGKVLHRVWQSAPVTPCGGRALLRELDVRARGALVLCVHSDEGNRSVCVPDGGKVCRALNLPGTHFTFRILAEDCQVSALSALFLKGENVS